MNKNRMQDRLASLYSNNQWIDSMIEEFSSKATGISTGMSVALLFIGAFASDGQTWAIKTLPYALGALVASLVAFGMVPVVDANVLRKEDQHEHSVKELIETRKNGAFLFNNKEKVASDKFDKFSDEESEQLEDLQTMLLTQRAFYANKQILLLRKVIAISLATMVGLMLLKLTLEQANIAWDIVVFASASLVGFTTMLTYLYTKSNRTLVNTKKIWDSYEEDLNKVIKKYRLN